MPFTLKDLVFGFGTPAIVAGVLFVALNRLLPARVVQQMPSPLALAAGFVIGYWLLELGPFAPGSYREWLPYMVLLAAIAASLPVQAVEIRCLLVVVVTSVTAWFLIPDWDHLEPSQRVYNLAWSLTVFPVVLALEALAVRIRDWTFPASLFIAAGSGAIVLLLSGSLRYCQIAGCGAGALAGITLISAVDRQSRPLLGTALPFAILLGGMLMIGQAGSFSEVPVVSYVLPPLAPLALSAVVIGPLSKLTGVKSAGAKLGLPCLVCTVALIIAVVAEYGTAGE